MSRFSKGLRIVCGCHARADRSFFFRGRQFPVCARCTGMLAGYVLGIAWLFPFDRWPLWLCVLACLPAIADGVGQLKSRWESTNVRRLITGVFLGAAIVHLLVNYHFFLMRCARALHEYVYGR